MEHREEMNCGGDLCKEMLELDKLLRASDSEEMMGGSIFGAYYYFGQYGYSGNSYISSLGL